MSFVLERPKRHADAKNQYKTLISTSHRFFKNRPFWFMELENVVCGSMDRADAWRALLAPGATPRLWNQSPSAYGKGNS